MTPARALLSWLVLLAVGFTNGVVRQVGYARWTSEEAAHQLSSVTAIAAIGAAVWFLTGAWPLSSAGQAWRVGAAWLVLTVLFETAMGAAAGHPWPVILGDYAIWRGRLWPLILAAVLLAPRIALAMRSAGARPP